MSDDPFEGLVGNEAARARLRTALRRPSHAYLLLGRPGYRLVSETWKTGGALSQGVEVEVMVVVKLPLLRALKPTRTIEEIRPTYKLNETAV